MLSKKKLGERLAKRINVTNKEAIKQVSDVLDEIILALHEGESIDILSILKFEVEDVVEAQRYVTDFKAKDADGKCSRVMKTFPAHKRLKVTVGSGLKRIINGESPKID